MRSIHRHAWARRAGLAVMALWLAGSAIGCATHAPKASGTASSYVGVVAAEDSDRIRQRALDPRHYGRYRRVVLEPVEIAGDVARSATPETTARVRERMQADVREALAARFALAERSGIDTETLRLRLVVTRITEAAPIVNAMTTALLGPVRNGALAVEAEALDASNDEQRGLYLWADEGSVLRPRAFGGNFRRAAHATQLAGDFAQALADYLAPLAAPPR